MNNDPFKAEKLFHDANISLSKTQLPVVYKTIVTEYNYTTRLNNGETMTVVIYLYTTGKERKIKAKFDFEQVINGSKNFSKMETGVSIDVAENGTFSILDDNGNRIAKGNVQKDKITGTVTRGTSNYQFTAKP